jgi:hypothetical protein
VRFIELILFDTFTPRLVLIGSICVFSSCGNFILDVFALFIGLFAVDFPDRFHLILLIKILTSQ